MRKLRKGFTLIELLIVIVIIGILAAIAIPKFGKTREKAYFKAMQSDLRNMEAQQEIYYSVPANSYKYAGDPGRSRRLLAVAGVTIGMAFDGRTGGAPRLRTPRWRHAQTCAVFQGTGTAPAPALTAGIVTCTNE